MIDLTQRAQVIEGDCLAVMRTLAPGSVDAIVTDPPYGIGFMNKGWDKPTGIARRRIAEAQAQGTLGL